MRTNSPITSVQLFVLTISLAAQLWSLRARAQQLAQQVPNEVMHVDLQSRKNLDRHHTQKYQSNNRFCLVLRRGELLSANIHLFRAYNSSLDKLRLELSFSRQTQTSSLEDGSLVYVPVQAPNQDPSRTIDQPLDQLKYEARIQSVDTSGKLLSVELNLSPTMAVGIWRLKVSTKLAANQLIGQPTRAQIVYTYTARELLYVLFNAWSSNDDVYLPPDDAREEYLLNEVGKIYIGSYSSPAGRKWTYGQFDYSVLPVLVHLLDRTKLTTKERSSAVLVSRAVSALVNSHNDNGLLAGNWSGNYGDGLAPWQWNGSPRIFQRYIENGYQPVKFGQCWVFGGVTTTSLRALGIPARTISNFVSAHDTDSSLTVDKFYSDYGREMSGVNGDSIWNFHVWSDAWMQRPDLPPGYGGWQAIDATPQEQSQGVYQLGPASLEAIKQGKVAYAYDVAFVFSEVNANVVYWYPDGRSILQWRKSRTQSGHVGRKILTKMIGILDERSRSGALDSEDIVGQYKYAENSSEARKALLEAARGAGLQPLFEGS